MSRRRRRAKPVKRPAAETPSIAAGAVRPLILLAVSVLVFVYGVAALWPVVHNRFVNWDDPQNILDNESFRGLGAENLKWAFGTRLLGVYQPLSWITFSAQYVAWDLQPGGYHAVAMVVHAAGAVIFFFVALTLLQLTVRGSAAHPTAAAVCAGLAAAVYAVHPLRAEPVAWVSCQPYVLGMFFYLLTLLCYLRSCTASGSKRASRAWYAAAVAAYLLAVLSKAIAVSLPAVLLLLDVYPLRRLGGSAGWLSRAALRVVLEKIPFVALAVATAALGSVATATNAPMAEVLGPFDRVSLAAYGLTFYVWKTIVPFGLSAYYQLPVPFDRTAWYFVLSVVVVVGVTVGVIVFRRRYSAALAAWAYYVIVLAPVLGIVQHGSQVAADRYSYLSCLSWHVLAAGVLLWCWQVVSRRSAGAARSFAALSCVVAVALLGSLSYLTREQLRAWYDSAALWRQALAVDPNCHFAHNNLGLILERQGDRAQAIEHYRRAVEIQPANVRARRNLALALKADGQAEEAAAQLREALRLEPDYAKAHNTQGLLYAAEGKREEAIHEFKEALRLRPDMGEAHNNLANQYILEPGQPRLGEAIKHWRRAVEISPTRSNIRRNLAAALILRGEYAEAAALLEEGLRLTPDDPLVGSNLAMLLSSCPNDSFRDGPRAVRLAEAAVRAMSPPDPQALSALAAAYAEVGRFDDAVRAIGQAIQMARQKGQEQVARQFEPLVARYRAHMPFRMPRPGSP